MQRINNMIKDHETFYYYGYICVYITKFNIYLYEEKLLKIIS